MEAAERKALVERLALAFGAATDLTPSDDQPAHILLSSLELPPPWKPPVTRALTIWRGWPAERPVFLVDEAVIGETGEPPRSNQAVYAVGESWRSFSFSFVWSGDDPIRAVQLWMGRFNGEPT